jgi:hypothetical protein
MKMRLAAITSISLVLTACGQHSVDTDAFIGTWKDVKGVGHQTVIGKNGDGLVVDDGIEKFPVIVKGAVLHADLPLASFDLVIDKATGHLLMGGEELKKVSN